MSNPPSDESRRTLVVSARFSEQEWDRAKELAAAAGKRPRTFLRLAALDVTLRPRLGPLDLRLIYELARIGNNLNQIAKQLNAGDATAAASIEDHLRTLSSLLEDLRG